MKLLVVFFYVCLMVGLGYYSMKKARDLQGFFLGNRSIGSWMSAFAYGTTYFSAVIFIGYAGKLGWSFGMSALWVVVGNAFIGSYLAWKVLGSRTREMTGRLGAMTMPEFLGIRYQSRALKVVSALIIFIFLVPYSASVYMGLSYLLEHIFQVPFLLALGLIAVLTGLYLTMGGYIAVTLADFIQGLIMITGVVFLVYYVVSSDQVGGLVQGISQLKAIDPDLVNDFGPPGSRLSLYSLVVLTSLGTWGLPQMIQKFYAIRDEQAVRRGTVVVTLFSLLIAFGAYFTGGLSHLFFAELPLLAGKPNPDLLMPQIISQALPTFVALIILLLVLSASMSTLSSLVLVSSSAVAIDLVQELFPNTSKKTIMVLMRLLCVLFVALSLYLALKPTIIVVLMSLSWGTVAGCFLAPYLYGLYWRGATRPAAWAGIITGLVISAGVSFYFKMDATITPIAGALGMIVPLFVVPLVSKLSRGLSEDHLEKVFGRPALDVAIAEQNLSRVEA